MAAVLSDQVLYEIGYFRLLAVMHGLMSRVMHVAANLIYIGINECRESDPAIAGSMKH